MRSTMAKEPLSEATREFGERVRARRHQLGKSQEQLAQESTLHWSYLGQVERDSEIPRCTTSSSSPRCSASIPAISSMASMPQSKRRG